MKAMKFGVGQSMRRKEDANLITGHGRYISDLVAPGSLRMALVRSPHAHARFAIGDLTAVRAMPGVRLVLTQADVAHLATLPAVVMFPKNTDGSKITPLARPVLPKDEACHVGEAIAAIVAESEQQALDAAEAFPVEWQPLPAAIGTAAAAAPGAPRAHEGLASNLAFTQGLGDEKAAAAAFAKAAKVVRLDLVNHRVVTNYMEPRGAIADFDKAGGRYTLNVSSQGVHGMRDGLCDAVFKIPRDKMRVQTPDVGGGFGTKMFVYCEYPLLLVAAEKLGRAVAWIAGRTEHFLGDSQGRDHVSTAELALDADNRFLGLRIETRANIGAYAAQFGASVPAIGMTMLSGTYRLPALWAVTRGIYTNTLPVDAYRGAGRPEAAYLLERLVDVAARDLGIAPEELRAKNLVTSAEMPYSTPTGRHYDTGDFEGHLRRALEVADAAGFPARRAAAERIGKIRGFGFSNYIECCAFGAEEAVVRLETDGTVTVLIGTQHNGQGHATSYAQFVAQELDIAPEKVRLVQGDTDLIATGGGTGGSRSIPVGGVSVGQASAILAATIKELAAEKLEAAAGDIEIADGIVRVAGTSRGIDLAAVASLPAATEEKRTARATFAQPEATYPNGTHVCEVEIDPETGVVSIVGYWIVDDFGVAVNPLLLAGQIHGGVIQSAGQALLEQAVYDAASGQLVTASFMDYAMPRADNMPVVNFELKNIPSTTNGMGIKGAGEAGTIGATPAVMNAVNDALHDAYGIRHFDMPATPARVWEAIRQRRGPKAA
jgi:carbon-monoxide dehydrogenase large subunit